MHLCNRSLQEGKFLSQWKEAKVSPIFTTKDRQNTGNCRPISLLSNIEKILERLVFMKLYEYCKSRSLLTWRNLAYKTFNSTVNYLLHHLLIYCITANFVLNSTLSKPKEL